jgi:hypothetical protein
MVGVPVVGGRQHNYLCGAYFDAKSLWSGKKTHGFAPV